MGNVLEKDGYKVYGSLGKKYDKYYLIGTIGYSDGTKGKPKWKPTGLGLKGNKKKAEALLEEFKQTLLDEQLAQASKKQVVATTATSICDFLRRCIDYKESQNKGTKYYICAQTAKGYRSIVNVHFDAYFTKERGITLETLTPADVEEFYEHRLYNGNVGENTVCHLHNLLSAAMTLAVRKFKILKTNVILDVEKPQFEQKKFRYFKPEAMKKYVDLLCKETSIMHTPVVLACYYGLRRSEIVGLQWDAIDFKNNIITIFRKVVEGKDGEGYVLIEGTKTDGSTRTLPLEPDVKEHLIKVYNTQQAQKMIHGDCYINENYVCTWPDGRFISPNYITHNHKKTLRRLEMDHIRFHDLRHSCASALAATGYSLLQIGDYLGHRDPKTTKRYAHLTYTTKTDMAGSMSQVLSKKSVGEQKKVQA